MKVIYTKCDDELSTDLALSDTKGEHIGEYGWLHRTYLKEYQSIWKSLKEATAKQGEDRILRRS